MDKDKKFLRRKLSEIGFNFFAFLSETLPLSAAYRAGAFFACIAYWVTPHRKFAIEGLTVAFPDMPLHEKHAIAKDVFRYMARWSFESIHFLRHPQELNRITIEGREHLDAALKEKKGVLIITAHMGNFPLLLLKLAKEGYTVNVMARPMRDEKTGGYIQNLRDRAGIKTILSYPRQECVKNTIRALRNNEIVVMLMDQNFGTGGVWVKFFGKLAATPVGLIVFALRTGAGVIPAYIYSPDNEHHYLRIFPAQELIVAPDKDETVLLNAVKLTRIIEGWVREFPCQWSWIHRRWKSRPSEQIMKAKFTVEK